MEICQMVSKVERERRALEAAEKDLQERRQKLVELEREEAQRELDRCLKKVGSEHALELLKLAIKVKPKAAVSALRDMADGKGQSSA
jgi:vacuolar-type H+-ATPase subunit H